jgi:hypothetical protein
VRSWSSEGVRLCSFKVFLGLSQVVAIKLNIRSQHRRSMSAHRHKPIDFAAEGLRLVLPVDRNCGIRD